MTDKITPTDIVRVALGLLATGGLHALAMRRIAAELDIQQSALYWHFDNKQQLLGAVADEIVSSVDVTSGDDWSDRIEELATQLRTELLRYPDGAELVATAVAFRLGAREVIRRFTDALIEAGLTPEDAEIATSALVHFVFGFTTDEQQHLQALLLGAIEADDRFVGSFDGRFISGVRLILAGVEARRDGRKRP